MYCIRLRICNETKALNGYKDELKPMFKSTPTQFQTTIYASSDETEIEDVPKDVPEGVPQDKKRILMLGLRNRYLRILILQLKTWPN